jgi:hypothetical protein
MDRVIPLIEVIERYKIGYKIIVTLIVNFGYIDYI